VTEPGLLLGTPCLLRLGVPHHGLRSHDASLKRIFRSGNWSASANNVVVVFVVFLLLLVVVVSSFISQQNSSSRLLPPRETGMGSADLPQRTGSGAE